MEAVMDWSDEEVEEGCKAFADVNPEGETDLSRREVRAIMTRAVELAAARGGTMEGGALEGDLLTVASRPEPLPDTATRLRQHIAALGARNAVLEAERDAALAHVALYTRICADAAGAEAAGSAEDAARIVRERDEARADNAAHVALWRERGCLDLGPSVDSKNPSSCIEQGWPPTGRGSCSACRALGHPHPGAALLEQHRQEVEAAFTEGTCVAGDKMRERFAQQEADHRLALIRARNEGLERAVRHFDAAAARIRARAKGDAIERATDMEIAETLAGYAGVIRAMKEPENG
jgi:hypothetical protein